VANVDVVIKTTDGKKTSLYKSFQAVATSEDVVYTVNSVKSQGIKIGLYFDEADDAYIEITNSLGQKTQSQLHCE
jgi:hypothetical protein